MSTQQLEKLTKIYEPKNQTMNLVVFGSGSGTNLKALLKAQKNTSYRVRALFSDRNCPILEIGKEHNIPTVYHSFVRFFKQRGRDNYQDEALRVAYDQEVIDAIDACAKKEGFNIDLVFLAGYMRVIHEPLLRHFNIVNVHPADLAAVDREGKRRYVGSNAIEAALKSGEKRTRSCVHIVTDELDGGPIIVSGPWVSYTGRLPLTETRVEQHQERQKRLSDWPTAIKAMELMSEGRVAIGDSGIVYIDGIAQPPGGFQM